MKIQIASILVAIVLLSATTASARNTDVVVPVKEAAESDRGQQVLSEIPFYMKGQKHPGVAKKLLEVNTTQSTSGAFRGDNRSCIIAFLSSMKVLQKRAAESGGNAIIDVVSTTRGKETASSTEFRCVAGTFVVHVGLKGQIVKLK